MKIMLSVDKRLADRASVAAARLGKTLDEVVHEFIVQLAGGEELAAELHRFEQSALASPGRLEGCWGIDRQEANRRR